MIDISRKFQEKRSADAHALGNYIHWHIQQNKITKKTVSEFLGVLPTTLNQ